MVIWNSHLNDPELFYCNEMLDNLPTTVKYKWFFLTTLLTYATGCDLLWFGGFAPTPTHFSYTHIYSFLNYVINFQELISFVV